MQEGRHRHRHGHQHQHQHQHQPWRISIHAKAKNLDFKFCAKRFSHSWSWRSMETRFSLILKVPSVILSIDSERGVAAQRRRGSLKSKLLGVWKKFRFKRKTITKSGKKSKRIGNEEAGFRRRHRSLLWKDQQGMSIDAFEHLVQYVLLVKNTLFKKMNLLVILVALMACSLNYIAVIFKDTNMETIFNLLGI